MAAVLLATACTGSPARVSAPPSTDRPSSISPGNPAVPKEAQPSTTLIVRSVEPIPADLRSVARVNDGVLAASEAAVFVADLESVDSTPQVSGGSDVRPVIAVAVSPDLLEYLPSGKAAAAVLRRGEAVVHEQAADLMGIEVGNRMRLSWAGSDRNVRVGAIVPGDEFFRYEVMLPLSMYGAPDTAHALVVAVAQENAEQITESLRRAAGHTFVSVYRLGSRAQADTVLSYPAIKALFGEFSFRRTSSELISPEADWVHSAIVRQHLPVLGWVECHTKILRQLSYALGELEQAGLASLVHSFDGCYVPRLQRNASALSSHTWGIAIDINAAANRLGERPRMDSRIVEIMKRWGFAWGGDFSIPDGMHFEFARFPSEAQYQEADRQS